ncbi:hypothetical protein [Pelagibius sp.]|uniref:hypothetical protein n=1 Tax=Pelagibius sp. TaxID=1931238 RepID=UPI003BAE6F5B
MGRIVAAALLSATLAGCVTAKERHLDDGYQLLANEEIRQLHAGKTHQVELASGRTATAFFHEDGRSTFKRSDRVAEQGKWEVRGERICFVYPDIPATKDNCHTVAERNGQYILFKEYSGRSGNVSAKVLSISLGNTQGLPLD